MTLCNHDPLYTVDGRCSKCYPPKRIIAVQHIDGTIETDAAPLPGYIPHAVNTLDDIMPIADEMVYAFMAAQHDDERGDGMAGNEPERCEAGGYG